MVCDFVRGGRPDTLVRTSSTRRLHVRVSWSCTVDTNLTLLHWLYLVETVEPHINGGAQTACAGMQGRCPTSVEIDELTV